MNYSRPSELVGVADRCVLETVPIVPRCRQTKGIDSPHRPAVLVYGNDSILRLTVAPAAVDRNHRRPVGKRGTAPITLPPGKARGGPRTSSYRTLGSSRVNWPGETTPAAARVAPAVQP